MVAQVKFHSKRHWAIKGAIYLREKNLPVYSPLAFDELQQIFGQSNA
jgi:hypothetical protein